MAWAPNHSGVGVTISPFHRQKTEATRTPAVSRDIWREGNQQGMAEGRGGTRSGTARVIAWVLPPLLGAPEPLAQEQQALAVPTAVSQTAPGRRWRWIPCCRELMLAQQVTAINSLFLKSAY